MKPKIFFPQVTDELAFVIWNRKITAPKSDALQNIWTKKSWSEKRLKPLKFKLPCLGLQPIPSPPGNRNLQLV